MNTGADLRRLTSLRAFAALAVFFHHAAKENNWLWHDRYMRYGSLGVTFFFILSGFVLTWAWREGDGARLFYVRRFARVWPAHVVALVTSVLIFAPRLTWEALVANLLLLQAWSPNTLNTLNTVSWSLSVEMFCYVLAPIIIAGSNRLSQRRFLAAAGGFVVASVGIRIVWSLLDGTSLLLYMQPALRLGEFVTGVMVATLIRNGWRPRIPMSAALGLAVVALLILSASKGDLPGAVPDIIMLPLFVSVVVAAASADLRGIPGVLQHRLLVYAGELSFAFYLLHNQVIQLAGQYVTLFPTKPLGTVYTLGAIVLTTLLAALLHHLVEKPAQRRIIRASRTRLPVPSLR